MRLLALSVLGGLAGFGLARWTSDVSIRADSSHVISIAGEPVAFGKAVPAMAAQSPPQGSARQRLADTLKGDDPFLAAQPLIDWIQASTIEDFREVVAEGDKFPIPVFSGYTEKFRDAYFDLIVHRWYELDPEGALRGIQSIIAAKKKNDNPYSFASWEAKGLLSAAARHRPVEVFENWQFDKQAGGLDPVLQAGFESLGASDPATARKYLDRLVDRESRRLGEEMMAKGVARSDPVAAVAIGKQVRNPDIFSIALNAAERISPGAVRDTIAAIGEESLPPWGLPELLLRHPEIAGSIQGTPKPKQEYCPSEELQAMADRLPPERRQEMIDRFDSLPPGVREAMGVALASSWSRTDPAKAAEWAMKLATPADRAGAGNKAAEQVFLRWINTSPEAAVEWWRSLPPSPLRDGIGTNASTFVAEQRDLELAMSLYHPQSGKEDEQVTAQLTQMFAERDPAQAAEWLSHVPEGITMTDASRTVIDRWFPLDPIAAAQWVESLPPGPRRDSATNAFVNQAAAENPAEAGEWVKTIKDQKLRQQAALEVFWRMRSENPTAAIEWFRALDGVNSQWHARLLRRLE
jgi:hypothetical protein